MHGDRTARTEDRGLLRPLLVSLPAAGMDQRLQNRQVAGPQGGVGRVPEIYWLASAGEQARGWKLGDFFFSSSHSRLHHSTSHHRYHCCGPWVPGYFLFSVSPAAKKTVTTTMVPTMVPWITWSWGSSSPVTVAGRAHTVKVLLFLKSHRVGICLKAW